VFVKKSLTFSGNWKETQTFVGAKKVLSRKNKIKLNFTEYF